VANLWDEDEDDPSPICGSCGVSALPAETPGESQVCENVNCDAFGEAI